MIQPRYTSYFHIFSSENIIISLHAAVVRSTTFTALAVLYSKSFTVLKLIMNCPSILPQEQKL